MHLPLIMSVSCLLIVVMYQIECNSCTVVFLYRVCIFFGAFFFQAVDCGQPQPIQNGSITGGSTVYPNVMQLICEEGFILRGSPDMRCQTNGTWSKASSFCEGNNVVILLLLLLKEESETKV